MADGKPYTVKAMATDGIMSVLLLVTGILRLPSLIPGAEFQLSAPFAVSIAKNLGFKRYLIIGIVASTCGFLLGLQNIFNITIAMIYRIVAGSIVSIWKNRKIALVVSGPCGTLVSRIVLAFLLHTDMWLLILYALPGMIFTAMAAPLITEFVKKILGSIGLYPLLSPAKKRSEMED